MRNTVKFEDNSKKVLSESDKRIKLMLIAIGEKALSIWRKLIDKYKVVDTGTFKRSTTVTPPKSKKITIGSGVDYARHLEVGTSRTKARPTLTESLTDYKDVYKHIAEQIFKG